MTPAPIVSVIVPVYNAEKTLVRCLDSILGQTLKEIEVVCVDDGSSDKSSRILDDYLLIDSRIKVIHQDNRGPSSARNLGLDHANGEYISFVDSDDYISSEMYTDLYHLANNTNALMVVSDYWEITANGKYYKEQSEQTGSIDAILKCMFSWNITSMNNRLIRRDSISARLDEFIDYMEDKLFIMTLLSKWKESGITARIEYCPKAFYYYDLSSNGTSLTKQSKKIILKKTLSTCSKIYSVIDKRVFATDYYTYVLDIAYNAFWNANTIYKLSEYEYQSLFQPLSDGILSFAPQSIKKRIVMRAISNSFRSANHIKWLLIPKILYDKVRTIIRTCFKCK